MIPIYRSIDEREVAHMTLSEYTEEIISPEMSVLMVLEGPSGAWRPKRIAEVERLGWGRDIVSVMKEQKHEVIFAQPYPTYEDAAKAATILNKVWNSQHELLVG